MKTSLFTILMIVSIFANADCWYNGTAYPTGKIVGGLTCQADGTWK